MKLETTKLKKLLAGSDPEIIEEYLRDLREMQKHLGPAIFALEALLVKKRKAHDVGGTRAKPGTRADWLAKSLDAEHWDLRENKLRNGLEN